MSASPATIIARAREHVSRTPGAPIVLGPVDLAARRLNEVLELLGGWAEPQYADPPTVRYGRDQPEPEHREPLSVFSYHVRAGCIHTAEVRYSRVVEAILYTLPNGATTRDIEEWLVACTALYLHHMEQHP